MVGLRKLLAGLLGTTLLAGGWLLAAPGMASAAGERLGQATPAQPYNNMPKGVTAPTDWLGSYTWKGKQVWCVRFALGEPGDDIDYTPTKDPLTNKWDKPIPAEVQARISYLLLRHQDTESAVDAAALAHLLHVWTAGTTDPALLDPKANGFATVGYDENFHFNGLTEPAKAAVAKLRADADQYYGPWTVEVIAPKDVQTIGQAGGWSLTVRSATGKVVPNVPVKLQVTAGTLEGSAAGGAVSTPADGKALPVKLIPTGQQPKLVATVDSPAAVPVLLLPSKPTAQRALTTGGQLPVTANATVNALQPPGTLKIGKVDAVSGAAIPGVALRLTGADKAAPALKQDGSKLLGADDKPVVLQTGQDGLVSVTDLQTPQEICLVEVTPAKGYDEGFNAADPPTVCGSVTPGSTLALTLTNKANVPKVPPVPKVIAAGDAPVLATATSATVSTVHPAALAGLAVVGLFAATLGGMYLRRRSSQR